MFYDVAIGAITKGVNRPTWFVINAAIFFLWVVLAGLLIMSLQDSELAWLAPHVGVMLCLCTVLGAMVNWFIASTGLTTAEEQEQSLMVTEDESETDTFNAQHDDLDEETREKLRNLPLQSNIDVGISGSTGFDTSDLAIKPMPASDIFVAEGKSKDKGE
eukprot:jgi/Ulvmu1/6991/UM033_0049.1